MKSSYFLRLLKISMIRRKFKAAANSRKVKAAKKKLHGRRIVDLKKLSDDMW